MEYYYIIPWLIVGFGVAWWCWRYFDDSVTLENLLPFILFMILWPAALVALFVIHTNMEFNRILFDPRKKKKE